MTINGKVDVTAIRIKLFASAKEIVGRGNSEITLEFREETKITFTELRKRILQTYPKLAQIPFVFAINYKIADESTTNTANTTITSSDEIALLPPISGG
ncbi:MAG TPA: MoaD/ThiS family protein [Nitrososphaeraceae archaeon]|jgi:molybdopterin converting factor small subunit|nr:MoaD/ThiS family protein [Nitrososphaeraceae archaeon]HZB99073.1 MoaD/ThiS family protein [Nitrososphaeraceae archaeon]